MTRIKSLSEIPDGDLTIAERAVLEAARNGADCVLGGGDLPEDPSPERTIRAEFLRFLALGGCKECPVREGVKLTGAWITGTLDLSYSTVTGRILLRQCHFEDAPEAQQATLSFLSLSGSRVPGLDLGGVRIEGHLQLRKGFQATGTVRLANSKIGGQLSCRESAFDPPEGEAAIEAANAEVRGNVLMDRGFRATGRVDLMGARVGGQLSFEDAEIAAADGDALNAQRVSVAQGLIFRRVTVPTGTVDLAAAQVGDLIDAPESWPEGIGRLYLNGFTYARIGGAFTDVKGRLKWLESGTEWDGDFFPQPYRQLADVLSLMGHDADARRILIALERKKRQFDRSKLAATGPGGKAWAGLHWLWDATQRMLTGYGYAATRSLYALAVLIVIASSLSKAAWDEGSMAPNSGPVLLSTDWRAFAEDDSVANPAAAWSADRAAGQDWETFHPLAYGTDTVVPILDFGQTNAWAPSTTRGPWGRHLWWMSWILTVAGWVVTALGAAAITGIIRSR